MNTGKTYDDQIFSTTEEFTMPYAADLYRTTDLISRAIRVISLDSAWTPLAGNGKPENSEPALMVAEEMLQLLAGLETDQDFLVRAAESFSDEHIEKIASVSRVDPAELKVIRSTLTPDLLRERMNEFAEVIQKERVELTEQVKSIRSGRPVGGDLSRRGKCYVACAVMIGGALAEAWPVAAAGFMGYLEYC